MWVFAGAVIFIIISIVILIYKKEYERFADIDNKLLDNDLKSIKRILIEYMKNAPSSDVPFPSQIHAIIVILERHSVSRHDRLRKTKFLINQLLDEVSVGQTVITPYGLRTLSQIIHIANKGIEQ